jgi:hypothetical protein
VLQTSQLHLQPNPPPEGCKLPTPVPPNVRYSSAFFAGKVTDKIHCILLLVRLRKIKKEYINVSVFVNLLDKWTHFLHNRNKPSLIRQICVKNKSISRDLFGSKVIDLL